MKQSDYRAEVAKVLYMMSEVFGGGSSDALLDAWTAVFSGQGVTIPELRDAAVQVMGTRRYNKIPPPAELLDIIRPRVDTKALAESQADLVLDAVRATGPYKTPTFTDPTTAELMATRWRWGPFASALETEKTKWWRRDFVEAYQEAAASPEVKRLPGKSAKDALRQIAARSQSTPPAQGRDADPPRRGAQPPLMPPPGGSHPSQGPVAEEGGRELKRIWVLTLVSSPTLENAYRSMGKPVFYSSEDQANTDRRLFIAPGRRSLWMPLELELNGESNHE